MLEAKHLLGQFFTQRAPILCGRRDVAVVAKIRVEKVREPAQVKEYGDLLLMKVFGRGLMSARRRNSALVSRRKIRC